MYLLVRGAGQAFLTLACAITCWPRLRNLSLCQDLQGANARYQDGYQPAGHDYQRLRMRTQAGQT